jgi:transcriptional repressor NrdR
MRSAAGGNVFPAAHASRRTNTWSARKVLVIKKDGRREPFRREKIEEGVQTACGKRPVSRQDIDALLDRVEARVMAMGQSEVESRQIGELVIEELEKLDKIAYVRFASVYRQFRSVDELMDEMKRIAGRGRSEKSSEGAQ